MTVRKSLRILLSAYACEPGRGSEPGVGWNWAVTLAAQGHKVWVLTRTNNKQSIEAAVALLDRSVRDNLHFVFHDLPRWARWWKKGGRGVHLYFSLWQLTLLSVAKKLAQEVQFDVAHHLTFGVWRQSSHLYKLNVPLIFGPVGGGESAPWRLVRTLPAADQVKEVIRWAVNGASLLNPALRACLKRSALVVAKTPETAQWVARVGVRAEVALEIGISADRIVDRPRTRAPGALRCMYAGRLVGLKGIHLALDAVENARRTCPGVSLTIVGDGPLRQRLEAQVDALGLGAAVRFVGQMSQEQLFEEYSRHDLLVFPSLHDSSGNVVLESCARGLPVVCLGLGGPAQIIGTDDGYIIDVSGKPVSQMIVDMAAAIVEATESVDSLDRMSACALSNARSSSWQTVVSRVYEFARKDISGAATE